METLFRAGVSNAVSATFLAMLVAALSRPLARRPAILHCLWLLVLLKLVTPTLYELPIPWPALSGPRDRQEAEAAVMPTFADLRTGIEMPAEAFVVEYNLANDLPDRSLVETQADSSPDIWLVTDWIKPIVTIWMVGTAIILVVSCRRILRFQSLLQQTQPASARDQGWVDAMASRIGLRRGPVFEWVQAKLSPMIWSLGRRARLIVPKDLWKTLDEPQRATLVVHELAHLRRGDHRVRYFELLVTALFWWHPLVWWVRQALRDAEEQCCDAWVVWAFPDAARSYAETLLETIDFLDKSKGPEPLLASGFGKVHHLRRRLTMILSESTPRRLSGWGMLGLFGLAALMLPVNATWAQKSEEPKKVEFVVKTIDDLATKTDGAVQSPIGTPVFAVANILTDVVAEVDNAPQDRVVFTIKTDDSPEVHVSGNLKQAIGKLKELISEIEKKSSRSEQDERRLKELHWVIEELVKVTAQVNATVRADRPGGTSDQMVVVLREKTADSPKKSLSKEEKAAIEKLQSEVKKLNGELLAKQTELTHAQARLAKLQGVSPDAPLLVRRLDARPAGATARVVRVPDTKLARKTVVINPKEIHVVGGKSPKVVESKKVDPKEARVEFQIHSDHEIANAHRVLVHPKVLGTIKRDVPADKERIEELEKKLKALLDEVANLKNFDSRFAPQQ